MVGLATTGLTTAGLVAGSGPAAAAQVTIGTRSTALGLILTNGHGRTVYLFTLDTPTQSKCGSTCRQTWPRVTSSVPPAAGTGVTQGKLGRTSTNQVTYNGHPLYYYGGDTASGQTHGQAARSFGGSWWVLSPQGTAGRGTTINLGSTDLGNVLVGARSRTLYLLTADGTNSSSCTGACAKAWPPVITTGRPHAGSGVTASLLGTALRPNGARQVTYNGHPLYSYSGDTGSGQTHGQMVFAYGGYWYVVNASGSPVF